MKRSTIGGLFYLIAAGAIMVALGFLGVIVLGSPAHGQLIVREGTYGHLAVPQTMCPDSDEVEFRVLWNGERVASQWKMPIGGCIEIMRGLWTHWNNGWFEMRCIPREGPDEGEWKVILPMAYIGLQEQWCPEEGER